MPNGVRFAGFILNTAQILSNSRVGGSLQSLKVMIYCLVVLSFGRAIQILRSQKPCKTSSVGLITGLRPLRSEEHTSELQSRPHLVCRLLLEKKKKTKITRSNRKKKKKKKTP